MGDLTSAIHWWEEWQLRILVLSSLALQFLLFIFCYLRRYAIPGWFRFIMWLAYLGSDAVAIYALATLFNRHKVASEDGGGGSSMLEVAWAPVLLLHLGGHDGITAYNIEDNELWTRHLLTAVSQVTVAIYVFCKSWPQDGDKRLLRAAILLFIPGILKCLAKPWAFKAASIHNLVSSHATIQNRREIYTLEEYVKRAKAFVEEFTQKQKDDEGEVQGTRSSTVVEDEDHHKNHEEEGTKLVGEDYIPKHLLRKDRISKWLEEHGDVSKLFVDISSSYSHRLSTFKHLWRLSEEKAYCSVKRGLASAFLLLYTKLKTSGISNPGNDLYQIAEKRSNALKPLCGIFIQISCLLLPWASIGLFHQSHRESYNEINVKITYALFCCTAVLELYSMAPLALLTEGDKEDHEGFKFRELWPEKVTQYSLIQFVSRNKRHIKWIWIPRLFGCKDFLDQHWCMKSCFSSARISNLVLKYLKYGWKEKIHDVASHLRFNDHSSHWVLEQNHCSSQVLGLSIKRPFDESVLLWHMATDFCFFLSSFSDHKCDFSVGPVVMWMRQEIQKIREDIMEARRARGTGSFVEHNNYWTSRSQCRQELTKCKAVQCRQMSNYMMYLLYLNPEMLLPGTRRSLFKNAYDELKDILPEDNKPSLFATAYEQVKDILLEDNQRNVYRRVTAAFKEMKDIFTDNKRNPLSWRQWKQAISVKEEFLMERLISAMLDKPKQASEEELKEGPIEESKGGCYNKEKLIDTAWALAQRLLDNNKGDEKKMWEDIEKVWVEMLCFSASRCRGYLHAKALGNGGEFLSYIWLLLFYMGMETFTDRLQRQEHQSWGGNNGTTPGPPSGSEVSAYPSPSSTSESEVSTGIALSPHKVHTDEDQSTSEIRMAAEDMV